MKGDFVVELTERDYLDANRLNFWVTVRSRRAIRSLVVLVGVYSILAILVATLGNEFSWLRLVIALLIGVALGLLLLAISYSVGYLLLPWRTHRLFKQNRLARLTAQYSLQDDGLNYVTPLSQGRLPFNLIHKWAESKRVLLIYISDGLFPVLPKRCIDIETMERVRNSLLPVGAANAVVVATVS